MTKPNTFLVGAPRCGTTAWVSYLSTHPDIYFLPEKEPHFFNTDLPGFQWHKTLESYEKLFENSGNSLVVGEASVQYLYSEDAARNIKKYNANAKILILLRNQTSFLPSYHHQLVTMLDQHEVDFVKAWHASLSGNINPSDHCREPKLLDYKKVGQFSIQVERYISEFGAGNVLVLHYDSWTKDPEKAWIKIEDFLGIQHCAPPDFKPVHVANQPRIGWINEIIRQPPPWLLGLLTKTKKVLGLNRLGIASIIQKINKKTGYRNTIDQKTLESIANYFEEDNDRLYRILKVLEQS